MKLNAKRKGSEGELEWCNFCKKYGFNVRRTVQFCGKSGDAADCVGLKYCHIEVKRVERLNIYNAMEQAKNDSKKSNDMPIVAHRKNRSDWLVTMKADDWFRFYKKYCE